MARARRLAKYLPVILGGSSLPFSDDFNRANGDLGNGWEYTAGKWTVASNAAVGTPALGSDVAVNGAFAADTDWNKGSGWSIGSGVASRDGTAGQTDLTASIPPLTVDAWFQVDWDLVTHDSGNGFSARIGASGSFYKTSVDSYVYCDLCQGTGGLGFRGNAEDGELDNVTAKQITLADMFATKNFKSSSIDIRAAITCEWDTQIGLVIALDDKDSPANFLLATVYRSGLGSKVWLVKCVAGVYSSVIGVQSITYSDGKVLRVVKQGDQISLYYNGTQEGSTQTLTDSALITGTRHGLFAAKGGSSHIDDFFCS